jgi:hypothetical protein
MSITLSNLEQMLVNLVGIRGHFENMEKPVALLSIPLLTYTFAFAVTSKGF